MPSSTVNFQLGPFLPRYYPRDVTVSKERRVKGTDALCEGEYMKDMGGKNRHVSVDGMILGTNVPTLNRIANTGEPMELISMQWSGEVLLKNYDIKGPTMWNGAEDSWMFDFTIETVSTGRDEPGDTNYGILTGGGGGGGGGGGVGGERMR